MTTKRSPTSKQPISSAASYDSVLARRFYLLFTADKKSATPLRISPLTKSADP